MNLSINNSYTANWQYNLYAAWQAVSDLSIASNLNDKSYYFQPKAIVDSVEISEEGKALHKKLYDENQNIRKNLAKEFTNKEERIIDELEATDMDVKAHENAHIVAGAGLTRGVHYEYEVGPDGKRYVVAGSVKIDASPENDPEATIRKMRQVKRAALAPLNPSASDRAVAAKASQLETQAVTELRQEKLEQAKERQIADQIDSQIETDSQSPYYAWIVGGIVDMFA